MADDLQAWIGRSETTEDVVTASLANRLEATLDSGSGPLAAGDSLRPLGHWCLFLPEATTAGLGLDGHPKRGGFLPPVHHLPRRMWAGGRLSFSGALRIGSTVERRSTIQSVKEKAGASGALVFVTVRHEIGEKGGPVVVSEEHDIVYRGVEGAAVKAAGEAPAPGAWQREIVPDAVLLFRYSALTFNGHRIHYDRSYVTEIEGYPGLIVHGPLIATLLLDLVYRHEPKAIIRSYSFRALSPVFDGAPLHLNGTPPDGEGKIALWASKAGGVAMQAEAVLA